MRAQPDLLIEPRNFEHFHGFIGGLSHRNRFSTRYVIAQDVSTPNRSRLHGPTGLSCMCAVSFGQMRPWSPTIAPAPCPMRAATECMANTCAIRPVFVPGAGAGTHAKEPRRATRVQGQGAGVLWPRAAGLWRGPARRTGSRFWRERVRLLVILQLQPNLEGSCTPQWRSSSTCNERGPELREGAGSAAAARHHRSLRRAAAQASLHAAMTELAVRNN